jgi:hypothetical protein
MLRCLTSSRRRSNNAQRKVQDNVSKNNALAGVHQAHRRQPALRRWFADRRRTVSFAENANAGWYSGYDMLPVAAQDVISAAVFDIRQAAVPVIISGLEATEERMAVNR